MSATIKEWLMAAEYIVAHGNRQVVLCERGIRTFETMTRNTFDLNAIPVLKTLTHLPVVVDPSHGVGVRARHRRDGPGGGGGRRRRAHRSRSIRIRRARSPTARSRSPSPSSRTS